jgi:ribosomal protein S18 acetylase RimI-like enzyme
MIIRKAKTDDIEHMISIKHNLLITNPGENKISNGFMLDPSYDQFLSFVKDCNTLILEDNKIKRIVGYCIIMPDRNLRISDLWRQKDLIRWKDFDFEKIENDPICYLEQLAVLPTPRYKFYAPALAFQSVLDGFEMGHKHLFTVLLNFPVRNMAAISMLKRIGAIEIGSAEDFFKGAGNLGVDVYYLEAKMFVDKVRIDNSPDYYRAKRRVDKNKKLFLS